MRVRIATHSPLNPLKAWVNVEEQSAASNQKHPTIADFKSQLQRDLSEVIPLDAGHNHIQLEIGGFQLISTSSTSVLRDGDLVDIRVIENVRPTEPEEKKRKIEADRQLERPSKRTKHSSERRPQDKYIASSSKLSKSPKNTAKPSGPSGLSSSSEASSNCSSSDGELESSSDASSSSASDSDSDSDSTSSSGSSPSVQHSKQQGPSYGVTIRKTNINTHSREDPAVDPLIPVVQKRDVCKVTVPPGQGKPSTRERNARRRKRRMHTKLAAERSSVQPEGSIDSMELAQLSSVTARPLSFVPTPNGFSPSPMITSLKNSNKKKGFRASMQQAYSMGSKKIVFSGNGEPSSLPVTPAPISSVPAQKPQKRIGNPPARLVPPSERTDLPPHVFVTSIDLEADLWGDGYKEPRQDHTTQRLSNGESKRQSKKHRANNVAIYEDHDLLEARENVVLDYGGPLDGVPQETGARNLDWANIEKNFHNYPPLSLDKLKPGTILGWKDLGIDPVTCTPQMILHLAEVVQYPDQTSPTHASIRLCKPTATEGSGFGAVLLGMDSEDDGQDVQTVGFDEMKGWKVINPDT